MIWLATPVVVVVTRSLICSTLNLISAFVGTQLKQRTLKLGKSQQCRGEQVTKDEATSLMDTELREHIPDNAVRWTVIEHLYKIAKRMEDDAKSEMVPFMYSKPAD